MEIKLIDNYSLIVQEQGYDLIEKIERTKKKSNETYKSEKTLGYNMSLESAVNRVVKLKLKDYDVVLTLKEFLEEFKQIRDQINKLIEI